MTRCIWETQKRILININREFDYKREKITLGRFPSETRILRKLKNESYNHK